MVVYVTTPLLALLLRRLTLLISLTNLLRQQNLHLFLDGGQVVLLLCHLSEVALGKLCVWSGATEA